MNSSVTQIKNEEKNSWIIEKVRRDGIYDAYVEDSYSKIVELFTERSKLPRGSTILDVGCGTGEFAKRLNCRGYKVIGIDISLEIVKNVNNGNVVLVVTDAEHLPFKSKIFDAVFCVDILHHFLEQSKVISQLLRVLKSEGFFFISDLNALNPHTYLAQSQYSPVRYDYLTKNESAIMPSSLRNIFKDYGQKIEMEYYFLERKKRLKISNWKYKIYGFIFPQICSLRKRIIALILFNIAHLITMFLPRSLRANIVIAYTHYVEDRA